MCGLSGRLSNREEVVTLALYSYRRLTDTDEPLVWRMLYEAARVAEEGRMTYEAIRFDRYLEKYAKGWGRPGDLGVGAFERNREEPVGCAWLRLLTGPERGDGYLDDQTPELAIGVVPAHRGRGVGTELLGRLVETARLLVPAVTLTVREGSPAIRLYERFGFCRSPGELVNRVGGQSVRMILTYR
jgi:ribosomal protein S18 acetylase RimI-like enzyme